MNPIAGTLGCSRPLRNDSGTTSSTRCNPLLGRCTAGWLSGGGEGPGKRQVWQVFPWFFQVFLENGWLWLCMFKNRWYKCPLIILGSEPHKKWSTGHPKKKLLHLAVASRAHHLLLQVRMEILCVSWCFLYLYHLVCDPKTSLTNPPKVCNTIHHGLCDVADISSLREPMSIWVAGRTARRAPQKMNMRTHANLITVSSWKSRLYDLSYSTYSAMHT